MEYLLRGIVLVTTMAITTAVLGYLVKSPRFKRLLSKSDVEELEAIERINRGEIPKVNESQYTFKTSTGKFLIIETLTLGMGVFMPFVGVMAYLESGKLGFLHIFLAITGIIIFLCGVRILLFEATKIHVSSDAITVERLFFRPHIIESIDIDKIILYWGTTNGIIKKKYFAADVLYKNRKKFCFFTHSMREKNTEKLVGYLYSKFNTEELKHIHL